MPHITLEQAQAAKRTARRRFASIDQVVGVGITRVNGVYAVKINLRGPLEPGTDIPAEIDGVPVRVEITGPIRAR